MKGGCICYQLLCNKLSPKHRGLEQHYLFFSCYCGSVFQLWVPLKVIGCRPVLQSSQHLVGKDLPPASPHVSLARFSSLWAVGLSLNCSLIVGHKPRLFHCHEVISQGCSQSISFSESQQAREVREREREKNDYFLYLHLRNDILSCHFTPFIRSKSLGWSTLKGRHQITS